MHAMPRPDMKTINLHFGFVWNFISVGWMLLKTTASTPLTKHVKTLKCSAYKNVTRSPAVWIQCFFQVNLAFLVSFRQLPREIHSSQPMESTLGEVTPKLNCACKARFGFNSLRWQRPYSGIIANHSIFPQVKYGLPTYPLHVKEGCGGFGWAYESSLALQRLPVSGVATFGSLSQR